jgi:AAA lid domain
LTLTEEVTSSEPEREGLDTLMCELENLFETAITCQANRVATLNEPTEIELRTLLPADFPSISASAAE